MTSLPTATYDFLERYLQIKRLKGEFTFTLSEVKKNTGVSEKATQQSLYSIKQKKGIIQIYKDLYAIAPQERSMQYLLSPVLFINDLMMKLGKRYYIALHSAAALYGALPHEQKDYCMIIDGPPLRSMTIQKTRLKFYVKKQWQDSHIIFKEIAGQKVKISSPALTALDLFNYNESGDTYRNITVLRELLPEIKEPDLTETANGYLQTPAIQRMGYILEKYLSQHRLAAQLLKIVKQRKTGAILLCAQQASKGLIDKDWNIIINVIFPVQV